MVGRKPRKKTSRLLGSHQRCWLWGRHAVVETLKARRWPPLEFHYDPRLVPKSLADEVVSLALQQGVSAILKTDSARITELCHASDHQGLLLKLPPFPFTPLQVVKENIQQVRATGGQPLLILLAGIQDPHNFGAIIRSAEVLGAAGIIVPAVGQAEVSPQVVRSSAGAVNYLDIAQVASLPESIEMLKSWGIQVVGASEKATISPSEADLCTGTLLVIGNEGAGLPPELLTACDTLVSIPQSGRISSLNAAVAAGVLCYEVQRQRSAHPA